MSESFRALLDKKESAKKVASNYFLEKLEGYSLKWARIHYDNTLKAYNYHALFYKDVIGGGNLANVNVRVYKLEGEEQHSFKGESIQYL